MAKQTAPEIVPGIGKIVQASDNFYDNLNSLSQYGAKPITAVQEAKARIRTAGRIGQSSGTYVPLGFEYAEGKTPLLRLRSRLLNPKLAKRAVEANRQGRYFSTNNTEFYEQSLEQAEKEQKEGREPWKRRIIALPGRDNFQITENDNFEVLQFMLRGQKLAGQYFEFNGSVPINVHLVDKNIVDSQEGTLLTQAWFSVLDNRSGIYGSCGYLDYGRVRGVSSTGEASRTQSSEGRGKSELPYTARQLDRALNTATNVREGRKGINDLDKVVSFLETLRAK